MFYEINVAKNGKHFFATAPRSIRTTDDLVKVLKEFKAKFTEEEGYGITASLDMEQQSSVNITELMASDKW